VRLARFRPGYSELLSGHCKGAGLGGVLEGVTCIDSLVRGPILKEIGPLAFLS
jgi:hypothetical protein